MAIYKFITLLATWSLCEHYIANIPIVVKGSKRRKPFDTCQEFILSTLFIYFVTYYPVHVTFLFIYFVTYYLVHVTFTILKLACVLYWISNAQNYFEQKNQMYI